MPDQFDKTLFAIADEADAQVDYDALRRRILEKRERQQKQERLRNLRIFGSLAACLMVLVGVGAFALHGGLGDKGASADMVSLTAAEAAAAEEAPVAEAAMEAPMLAMYDAEAAPAAAEPPVPMMAEPAAAAGANGKAAVTEDPKLRLVNRQHAMAADEIPQALVTIAEMDIPSSLTLKRQDEQGDREAVIALLAMMEDAKAQGMEGFYLVSVYRSYEEQRAIWDKKVAENPDYGQDGAPVASMPPGESEHQTGLAFDITAVDHRAMRADFDQTPQGAWLKENCANHGFILRYPADKEDITGVVYEPWHFRYVGVEMARYLTENGLTLEEALN